MRKYIKTDKCKDSHFIKVETYYHLGGWNYFTGQKENRGIYLSFLPVRVENHEGYSMESFEGFSGAKFLIKELNRKSDKQLALVDSQIKDSIEHFAQMFEDGKVKELGHLIYSIV